jgi:hypothetical protein
MSTVMHWLTRTYALLLRLYPRDFRDEFSDEMRAVFAEAVAETATHGVSTLVLFCLSEVRDLLHTMLLERLCSFTKQMEGTVTNRGESMSNPMQKSATWAEICAGMAPFLLYPLLILIGSVLNALVTLWSPLRAFEVYVRTTLALFLIVPFMIVLVLAWIKNFPRWSFPYLGLATVFSLYLTQLAFPGIPILGYPFGQRELLEWRAFIPLMIVVVSALLLTRSLRPLGTLVRGVWNDWTQLSFGLYGILSPLMFLFAFEEIRGWEPLEIGLCIILAIGAMAYIRGAETTQRMLSLLVALTTAWIGAMICRLIALNVPNETPWAETVRWMTWFGVVAVLFVSAPALVGIVRRAVDSMRAA